VAFEKHFLVAAFLQRLVAHARDLFRALRVELDSWIRSALLRCRCSSRNTRSCWSGEWRTAQDRRGHQHAAGARAPAGAAAIATRKQVEELTRFRDVLTREPATAKVAKVA